MVRGGGQPGAPFADTPRMFATSDPALHFTAMITLSRLIRKANEVIHGCEPNLGEAELLGQGSSIQSHSDASPSHSTQQCYSEPPVKAR